MKEECKACRYCGTAVIKGGKGKRNREIDNWCSMKRRETPKNPCKWWRPKKQEEAAMQGPV
jgi:hypothetical protein